MIDIAEIYKTLQMYLDDGHDVRRMPQIDYIKPLANTFIVGFSALYSDEDKRVFYYIGVFLDSRHMSNVIACGQV